MNNYHTTHDYHATMAAHYAARLADPATTAHNERKFLTLQRDYHRRELAKINELQLLADELRVAFADMLHLGRLVATQMESDEACAVDADPNRVKFTAGDGEILAWYKTQPSPVNATA